jgi:hypothetical protein
MAFGHGSQNHFLHLHRPLHGGRWIFGHSDSPPQNALPLDRPQRTDHLLIQPDISYANDTNEYGISTWAKVKAHVEALELSPAEALTAAVCQSDAAHVNEVLDRYAELRARIDDPLPDYDFGEHALFAAVQRIERTTIGVLLRVGANIGKRTEWCAGRFGVQDDCDPSMVEFLTQRGAVLDAHSASRLWG